MGPVAGSCFERKFYITGHVTENVVGTSKTYSFYPFEQEGMRNLQLCLFDFNNELLIYN
jgi:hypothetical protein